MSNKTGLIQRMARAGFTVFVCLMPIANISCGLDVPPAPQYDETVTLGGVPAVTMAHSPDSSSRSDSSDSDGNIDRQNNSLPQSGGELGANPVRRPTDAQVDVDAGVLEADAALLEQDASTMVMDATPPGVQRCQTNEYVLNGRCTNCPPGTQNDAGDSTAGPNTQCSPILCGENERVRRNACRACGDGTQNEAGDSAAGPNTSCDAILCREDERVRDNQCEPCPPGTQNEAGDSAAGVDTDCEPIPQGCFVPRTIVGGSTLAGYEFRLIRNDAVLDSSCDEDIYLTRAQVDAYVANGIDFSDEALSVQWRFTVSGPINVRAGTVGDNVRLIVNGGMTIVLGAGSDTIVLNAPMNELTLIYPASLAVDPPAIQLELREQ